MPEAHVEVIKSERESRREGESGVREGGVRGAGGGGGSSQPCAWERRGRLGESCLEMLDPRSPCPCCSVGLGAGSGAERGCSALILAAVPLGEGSGDAPWPGLWFPSL